MPTLDGVRDKIERRYANALGAQELAKTSMNDRMAEIEAAGTDIAASSRLAEIRASMGGELEAGAGAAGSRELEQGAPAADETVEGEPTTGKSASGEPTTGEDGTAK